MAPTMGLCGMVRTHSQRRRVVDLGVDIKLSIVLVFFPLSLHNIRLWFLLISIAILLQFPLATYMHTWSKKIKYPVFKSIFLCVTIVSSELLFEYVWFPTARLLATRYY